MKKLLCAIALIAAVGCSEDGSVILNDHKDQIDANTAQAELNKAKNDLQDLEIASLDARVTDLENRMDQAESDILANTDLIIDLTDELSDEIDDLRDELADRVRELRRADRQTRGMLLLSVAVLNAKINREVRQLEDADDDLQDQIDDLNTDVARLTQRFNVFRAQTNTSLLLLGISIAILRSQIDARLDDLEDRVSVNEDEIDQIQSDVSDLQDEMTTANSNIAALQTQLLDVESRLTSVVYPCGEGNSEEVLLQTQDGLVAYFQTTKKKTLSFNDSITIPEQVIPGHHDRYCVDTNFFNGECNDFDTRFIPGTTIPEQTYSVGDTANVKLIDKAYLDVLGDGSYGTTDGYSCNFTISNGEVL